MGIISEMIPILFYSLAQFTFFKILFDIQAILFFFFLV